MAKMDIDDVVDLSIGSGRDTFTITPATVRDLRALTQNSGLTITPAPPPIASYDQDDGRTSRRVLRPRTEPKSYAEAPDIVLLPAKINGRQPNGNIDSETDDEEMPLSHPIKELTVTEIKERERALRKLKEELRNEETKLVLLKKLKQSQNVMKENIIVTPTNISPTNTPLPTTFTKGTFSVTPTTTLPLPSHGKNRSTTVLNIRCQPSIGRTNIVLPPPRASLPGGATLTAGATLLRNNSNLPRAGSNLTITPSVTITPTAAPPAGAKPRNVPGATINNSVSITPAPPLPQQNMETLTKNDRSTPREEVQTPAQRQAAAKLALRKQLEKTLLQIPPPKPPPPEMHFIPNPSNTEFVYLLGLETVVDYLMTKDKKSCPVLSPFRCAQCKIDFTPVWKWDKIGKEPKVICEQCVTTNVKKALKAEHTNRLKTAFVKALQQEQEIEQRLASQSSPSPVDSHSSIPVPPQTLPTKSQTVTSRPTPPPPSQPTPPPPPPAPRTPRHDQTTAPSTTQLQGTSFEKYSPAVQLGPLGNIPGLGNITNLSNIGNIANSSTAVAAMQAFQQQVFRGLQQGLATGNPHHVMTPLFYSYQLAMAQAAQAVAGKNSPSLADIQRAAEMHRQYLLEMIPPQAPGTSNSRQNNWKT